MPDDALAPFHPIVREWFTETLGAPSAPQRAGWPAIAGGEDTLILAPTGTGKTLFQLSGQNMKFVDKVAVDPRKTITISRTRSVIAFNAAPAMTETAA